MTWTCSGCNFESREQMIVFTVSGDIMMATPIIQFNFTTNYIFPDSYSSTYGSILSQPNMIFKV